MVRAPETHYAQRPDGVNIGYQALGDGPLTLIWCWGWVSHLDLQWTDPGIAGFFERLAAFCRLVIYDKAGTGVSDPVAHLPTLEERVDEIRVVLDAVGADRAAIFGESEGAPPAALFAATYPERTQALIVWGMVPKGRASDEELAAFGGDREQVESMIRRLREVVDHWGEGRTADVLAPSITNPMVRRGVGTYERASVSRGMASGLIEALMANDVTGALPAVAVPTLVMHRTGDVVPLAFGRMVSAVIPGARFVAFTGSDHTIWTQDPAAVVGEIQQFLTGSRAVAEPDRVLATVLFTDIVESTGRAAALGDAAWRALLERHDDLVATHVTAAGGRVIKSLGDGALAMFPAPAAHDQVRGGGHRRRGCRPRPRASRGRPHRRVRGARRRPGRHRGPHRRAHQRARGARGGARVRDRPRPRGGIGAALQRPRRA
jgi:pimeloyl-ACP methyl ester carboxylesterase